MSFSRCLKPLHNKEPNSSELARGSLDESRVEQSIWRIADNTMIMKWTALIFRSQIVEVLCHIDIRRREGSVVIGSEQDGCIQEYRSDIRLIAESMVHHGV